MNNNMSPITTAVLPIAGLGTRFLPITKAEPKEMLPIVDKPVIQYVVEEAVAAGITHLIFVTSSSKWSIENYFDSHYELESRLEAAGKLEKLSIVKNILPPHVTVSYIRQAHPLGLGHAILQAKNLIQSDAFAVLLSDDIITQENCTQSMIDVFEKTNASVIAVENIPQDQTQNYGIVKTDTQLYIEKIIEKPKPQDAPSTLGVIGRYILHKEIFTHLEKARPGVGGEIQLTDAIATLLQSQKAIAYHLKGKRFDCGTPLGLLKATIDFALQRPELNHALRNFIEETMKAQPCEPSYSE